MGWFHLTLNGTCDSFDEFQDIRNLRGQDCGKYIRMITCLEILSGDDKNNTTMDVNLNDTLTAISKLSEVPVEQITKSEVLVSNPMKV